MQCLDIISRDVTSQKGLAWAWLGKRDNPESFSAITVQEAVSGSLTLHQFGSPRFSVDCEAAIEPH